MSNNKQSSVFVKTMIFVLLAIILTVGVTYAYFRATITGVESESTISIGGATLKIVYEGTETINAENVIPGWSAKKYFNVDVTNTSGKDITYDINLVVTNSNFNTTNDTGNSYLEYALYKCTSNTDTACETTITSSSILDIQSGEKKVYSVKTKASVKTYYALELSFPNQDAVQSQTGTNDQPLTFNGYVTLVSGGEVYVPPFTTDSWGAIASNIKSGNTSMYKVGDTKEVAIDGFTNTSSKPTFTVRIANNSTPSECATEGFSQTACGFVVEFVDIITDYNMNPAGTYNETEYPEGTNLGGWPGSAMYKYLNGDTIDHLTYKDSNNATIETLYSKLPSDLRSVIIDTYSVSGHGNGDTGTRSDGNFESTDKLYLLSTGEIYSICLTGEECADTASSNKITTTTRQLDYYQSIGVSSSIHSGAIKQKNGSNVWWWLRAADTYYSDSFEFRVVGSNGNVYRSESAYEIGAVAPAFRIG